MKLPGIIQLSKIVRLKYAIMGFWVLILFTPAPSQAHLNNYEIKVINDQIQKAFDLLIDTWNEELYFEMYDLGQYNSKKRLTRSEFSQRMVELKWKPSLKPINIDKIDILYRNFAIIYFVQEFENKVNSLNTVEKSMTFPVVLEGEYWRFDLTQLISIPYEGKFVENLNKTKLKEEKNAKTTTKNQQDTPSAGAPQPPEQ